MIDVKEPQTDIEFEQALRALGCDVEETDENEFTAYAPMGGATVLDATDYSSALAEAWNLMKD